MRDVWSWIAEILAAIVAAFWRKKPKKLKHIEVRLRVVDMTFHGKGVKTCC